MAIILDGKKLAEEIKNKLKNEILKLGKKGIIPSLAVVLVGKNPASEIYIANKEKVCYELGINSKIIRLEEKIEEKRILEIIKKLNRNKKIHGILVQLPLPKHINQLKIIEAIDVKKDVDGFHPENIGRVTMGRGRFYPCTPAGIMEIFKKYAIKLAGKDCVIVGRSSIVGRPLASMLLAENATVTICHSQTRNLADKCRQADILISAAGKSGLIKESMVKNKAVIIDVGINRDKQGKISGDVDFIKTARKASAITPVPGGVGPMTVVMLMKNTVEACKNYQNL